MNINDNIESLRSLSQIFSTANFNKIVRKKDYVNTFERIRKHTTFSNSITNLELLDNVYNELLESYRSEYVYKNALINKKLIKKYSLKNTIALNEFKIGNSIADFVLLNGKARVFEIKTELDGLDKLEKQISDYYSFATEVYIVTSSKHIEKLIELYKETKVGIIELTQKNSFKEIKPALSNIDLLDHSSIFKSLRKNEYVNVLKANSFQIPKVPNTLIFKECLNLSKNIHIEDFQKSAIKVLKKRNIKNPDLLKDNRVPNYLKHICYSLNLSKPEYEELNSFLNKPSNLCISRI
ncbi:sce7726 family protein [Wenyingzhuangia sp. IMCC45533]